MYQVQIKWIEEESSGTLKEMSLIGDTTSLPEAGLLFNVTVRQGRNNIVIEYGRVKNISIYNNLIIFTTSEGVYELSILSGGRVKRKGKVLFMAEYLREWRENDQEKRA